VGARAQDIAARVAAAIWGGAILFGLAVGAFGGDSMRDAVLHDGPGCPFRTVTGIDCPFCGMTRATLALGSGELHHALGFHPLAPLVLAFHLGIMGMIVAGRGDVFLKGRRIVVVLGAIGAIWILRFVL
jgi:hypothetical protein